MSLKDSSVLVDGSVATTGGTGTPLKSLGNTLEQHELYLDESKPLIEQTTITASVKRPKVSVSAPNGYTQGRNTVYIKVPLKLDNGSITVNTIRLEIAADFETSAAERLGMRVLAAQMLTSSQFVDFWDDASVD
jgi:hypothetical protein